MSVKIVDGLIIKNIIQNQDLINLSVFFFVFWGDEGTYMLL